jgi:hypothetical protein
MDFFKIPKGGSAIVRFLHTSVNTMPIVKVHTVTNKTANGNMSIVVKCNDKDGHTCPLCEKYPKQEYQRVIALYDYTDGQVKCFKTASRTLIGNVEDTCADWGKKPVEMVFKLGREDNEFGSYYVSVMPEKNYPMPENLEIGLDEDVTYRFGLYRSDSEMEEYLKTGTMPKHQKSDGGNREDTWAKQYNNAPTTPATPPTPIAPPQAPIAPVPTLATAIKTNFNPQVTISTPVEITTTNAEPKVDDSSTFTFENDDFQLPF